MAYDNHNDNEILISHPCYGGHNYKRQSTCPAYCDCNFPTTPIVGRYNGHIPDLIKCRCGEDDPTTHTINWNWHECSDSDAIIKGQDVTFHPTFSQGTAIVRGEQPLSAGMLHFWEMRILTVMSGTDVMFGVGTDKVNPSQFKFHYVSALGTNCQSWGFSYEGKIHHNGINVPYGQRFSQGCIVGVLLDRIRGQLEFFLNRRSLGIAYTNIPKDPNVQLYPMVCSTIAQSCIRLMNATSQVDCLQLRSFQAMAKQQKGLEELRKMPGLKNILNNYWFLAPPVRYSRESKSNEYDMLDEAVLSTKSRLSRKHKYRDDEADINDLYSNAHKIVLHQQSESDDEYFHYLF